LAGGLPILLPVTQEQACLEAYINIIDGLLLTGGNEDVSPLLYNENPLQQIKLISPERDSFEIALIKMAFDNQMPILGVCRGIQTLNVAMGGNLYQDIFIQVPDCIGHNPEALPVDVLFHEIYFKKGSRLEKIFGCNSIQSNSFHHQAVKNVAPGFYATAFSVDNIIEAIEHAGDLPIIGVQCHPEDLTIKYPAFIRLFKFLVEEASKKG
jgi:putative glutamine amidotransferase